MKAVAIQTLQMRRRSLIWWSVGLASMVLFYSLFYPTIHSQPSINDLLKSYPKAVTALIGRIGDLTTPAGFLNAEVFSFMLPLLLLIFAIGFGAREIAGEEENGTLELLLSTPLSRTKLVVARAIAMATALCLLAIVVWIALIIASVAFEMEIGLDRLAAATMMALLLALLYGTVALAAGCWLGRRGIALSVAVTLAAAAYLVRALATVVESLHDWQSLSPFYYYNHSDPLRMGFDFGDALLLSGACAVFLLAAVIGFKRRDIR